MKSDLPNIRYIVVAGNAEVEEAGFMWVKEAEEWCDAHGDGYRDYKIIQRIDGREVIGRTSHGNAILSWLGRNDPDEPKNNRHGDAGKAYGGESEQT